MDQTTLVNVDLDAGATLICRFHESTPVAVAFWIRRDTESPWQLCIASERWNSGDNRSGYAQLMRIAKELRDPNIDPFRVHLLGANDPLAQAAFDIGSKHSSSLRPIHHDGRGMPGVEEAFIYPIPSGLDTWNDVADARWKGIMIHAYKTNRRPEGIDVTFLPHQLQTALWPGGQTRRIPRPARVELSGTAQPKVTGFEPPEQPFDHITQEDYERKAILEVARMAW